MDVITTLITPIVFVVKFLFRNKQMSRTVLNLRNSFNISEKIKRTIPSRGTTGLLGEEVITERCICNELTTILG